MFGLKLIKEKGCVVCLITQFSANMLLSSRGSKILKLVQRGRDLFYPFEISSFISKARRFSQCLKKSLFHSSVARYYIRVYVLLKFPVLLAGRQSESRKCKVFNQTAALWKVMVERTFVTLPQIKTIFITLTLN